MSFTDSLVFFPPCGVTELFYKYTLPLVATKMQGREENSLKCLQVIAYAKRSHDYEITLGNHNTILEFMRRGIEIFSQEVPQGWMCDRVHIRGFWDDVNVVENVIQRSKKRETQVTVEEAKTTLQKFLKENELVEEYF